MATPPPAPPKTFAEVLKEEHAAIALARKQAESPEALPEGHSVGLALSGGGIRSATFCLGVIQALAAKGKLRSFDYLSTVSGGGFIGAWLSAWIHRDGLGVVEAALQPRTTATDPRPCEAPEVTWLRRYSNYLAPRAAMLSADSLTLVTTWLRNVFLNLVIVVSLLALLFLVARLLIGPAIAAMAYRTQELGYAASWIGLFLFPAAVSFNLSRIRMADGDGRANWLATSPGVLATVLLPGVIATVFASLSLFSPESRTDQHLAGLFVGALALLFAAGVFWFAWQLLTRRKTWPMFKEGIVFVVAYAAALLTAYLLVSGFIGFIRPAADLGLEGATDVERAAKVLSFGPPALLATFSLSGSVLVGIVGRTYFERSREWWSRMNAWFFTIALAWLAFFALAFYARPLVAWAVAMSGTWFKALAGAGWLGSLLATLLLPKPNDSNHWLQRLGGKALDLAALLVVVGFLVGVACGTSAALAALADTHNRAAAPKKLASVQLTVEADGEKSASSVTYEQPAQASVWPYVVASFKDEAQVRRHEVTLFSAACEGDEVAAWVKPLCALRPAGPIALTTLAAAACLLVFLLFGWRVDVNKFSLHNLYKNRLIRCYLGASRQRVRVAQPFTGFDDDDDPELCALRQNDCPPGHRMRPLHIVNTALNITHGTNLAWQERKAASFTFTPLHCGYALSASVGDTPPGLRDGRAPPAGREAGARPVEAYRDAAQYGSQDDERGHFTLGSAMATSGAAVSPNMGRATTKPLAFVTTLFNVRLGRWSPNPNRRKWMKSSPSYGLFCLLQELLGFANESRNYVYLSDGGHFDNTGIYELVHRRCTTIVAVDAGADVKRSFSDLAHMIRKCRVDFGVEIELDITKLGRLLTEEAASPGYVIGDIGYCGGPVGKLVVIKPTRVGLLAQKRVDVFGYAQTDEAFPQQTTVDQFFDESQFESYRALGQSIAEECLKDPKFAFV